MCLKRQYEKDGGRRHRKGGRNIWLALLQLSDLPRAHELAEQELALATKQQVAGAIGQALITIGLVEGGEDGIRRLHEAVSVLERSPLVLTRVRALTELGSMLRRNGQRQAARGFLQRRSTLRIAMEPARLRTERARS